MILTGDCVELMRDLEPSSVDAVVCDPPYGLGFMGKEWDRAALLSSRPPSATTDTPLGRFDTGKGPAAVAFDGRGFQSWCEVWATEALRVLKPGGHLLAFGGTRTYHRLACAIEDAGFEIRDCLCWMYGSGFPKSLDVSKAIDKAAGVEREVVGHLDRLDQSSKPTHRMGYSGPMRPQEDALDITAPATDEARTWQGWGTALKPAHEPIVVARKPLAGTVAGNVLEHGTGALNVDGCRVEGVVPQVTQGVGEPTSWNPRTEPRESQPHVLGRWPANVVLDEEAAAMLDEQTGERHSAGLYTRRTSVGGMFESDLAQKPVGHTQDYNDSGGASRFFYVAKASRAERNAGLEGFEESSGGVGDQRLGGDMNQRLHRDGRERVLARNTHPTVKPIALMRWLVRLVTPPGGLVLDPFTGSGTTGIAAGLEGFRFLGMEQDASYSALADARIAWWAEHGEEALRIVAERERAESERAEISAAGQLELL